VTMSGGQVCVSGHEANGIRRGTSRDDAERAVAESHLPLRGGVVLFDLDSLGDFELPLLSGEVPMMTTMMYDVA
jgi:hypothetical protein